MTKQLVTENPRILELKEKIKDDGYVQGAIQRIALVLSNRLIEVKDITNERLH
jgi:hypothetical protein